MAGKLAELLDELVPLRIFGLGALPLRLVGKVLDPLRHAATRVPDRAALAQQVVLRVGPDHKHQHQRQRHAARADHAPRQVWPEGAVDRGSLEAVPGIAQLALREWVIGAPVEELQRGPEPLAKPQLGIRASCGLRQ